MAATTVAGMSVDAPEGAAGVAYAGYQAPADRGTGLVWVGRADLAAAPGGWQEVDAAGLSFTWTRFDMLAQRQAGDPVGVARIPAFIEAHGGDGPGFFTLGFGCDGRAFNMDAWRIGAPGAVTTYDLEGLTTVTSMSGPPDAVIDPGGSVTLSGSVTDGSGAPLSDPRLVLEAQGEHGAWTIVDGVSGDDPAVEVAPESTTTYRWHFVDRPLAEGSVSAPFTVGVREPAPVEGPIRKGAQRAEAERRHR